MDYLNLFKLLLAITLFASVIATENSNEATKNNSKEWIDFVNKNSTRNDTEEFDFQGRSGWLVTALKTIGKAANQILDMA